jgi:hypothetical protein
MNSGISISRKIVVRFEVLTAVIMTGSVYPVIPEDGGYNLL